MKSYLKTGEPYVMLTGAGLAVILIMTLTLVAVVLCNGLGYFWPHQLTRYQLKSGATVLGQLTAREKNPMDGSRRIQLKVANRDMYGQDFRWIDEKDIVTQDSPKDAVVVERREHGDYMGFLKSVQTEGLTASAAASPWERLELARGALEPRLEAIKSLKERMSDLNFDAERLRLKIHKLEYAGQEKNAAAITELTTRPGKSPEPL